MTSHYPEPPNRRTFLNWAVEGLGAIFALIFGAPVVAYLIDPRNRPSPPEDFRPVAGVTVRQLRPNHPLQGVIRNVRRDAWTLYPDDVIGRVWINRKCDGDTADCFEVFTTVCPHLGCAINCDQAAPEFKFICPCHNGQFACDGARRPSGDGYENPAPRSMDSLEFRLVGEQFEVKYLSFQAATPDKVVRS